jgi:hypothetical protein
MTGWKRILNQIRQRVREKLAIVPEARSLRRLAEDEIYWFSE